MKCNFLFVLEFIKLNVQSKCSLSFHLCRDFEKANLVPVFFQTLVVSCDVISYISHIVFLTAMYSCYAKFPVVS